MVATLVFYPDPILSKRNYSLRNFFFAILVLLTTASAGADQFGAYVTEIQFEALQQTFDQKKVSRILGSNGRHLNKNEQQAAAVLVSLGVFSPDKINDEAHVRQRLDDFRQVIARANPYRLGRIGETALYANFARVWKHDSLLAADEFLAALGEELSAGVITGYDLRAAGVYDGFPPGHTFIYSQSSMLHMQQLIALLNSEQLGATVYATPKVSAFVYRDDWGAASGAVKTLPGGTRVINGREIAVLFQFDSPEDRLRFHQLITRFAKKDEADEAGLIENAWWQPFYYSDTQLKGFEPISLVVMKSDRFEATLTVLSEKTDQVLAALVDKPWPVEVHTVWVNPPFHRFLLGGYK